MDILLRMNFSAKRFKYIIIDSQIEDTVALQEQLKKYPQYLCVGIAKNKLEAINLILDQLPDLVFLEVELNTGITKITSFSILHELLQFINILPTVVAMSHSTEYSYQAIKTGVFDYLLKPVDYFELKKCLLRFEKKQPASTSICIKSFTEFRFLLVEDILYLKADNNTTDFYLKDGTMVTAYQSLKSFEAELPNIFMRIHKSYMVNLGYLTKIHFSKFYCSLKYSKSFIPFSKSLKSKMMEIKDLWPFGMFNSCPQQSKLA